MSGKESKREGVDVYRDRVIVFLVAIFGFIFWEPVPEMIQGEAGGHGSTDFREGSGED